MTVLSITLATGRREAFAGARSALYGYLSDALSYPDDEFMRRLRSGAWAETLAGIAGELPIVLDCGRSACEEDLAGAYVNLFEVGVGRPFCPLYEGSHRNGRLKLMEDLVRFYEHFGLKTSPGDHPDHICAELEFMHYLSFKEAAIEARGEEAEGLRLAQAEFLDRHLCQWLPRVISRLAGRPDAPRFYLELIGLTEEFCRRDRQWLKEAT